VVLKNNSDLTVREKAHIMAMMQKNAFSLRRMAYMLYDATWLEKGQKLEYHDLVSCNAVARKAIDTLHRFTPGKDDTVIFETALDDDIQLRTHEAHLSYIIHELLYNAKKFASDGRVKLMVYETPATVNFAIEDEGPGIPAEEQQRIFNHFFKHSPFSEGLGLGLYLCRHYIRLMGGELSLDTTYEKGSRFIIRLPLA
jgi:signal transduction histidine kinase